VNVWDYRAMAATSWLDFTRGSLVGLTKFLG
jgi:hypothetical protein